jgi:Sigma-70 region 2
LVHRVPALWRIAPDYGQRGRLDMDLDVLSVVTGIDARPTSHQRHGSSMPGAAVGQELFHRWLDRYDIAAIDRLVRIHRYIAVEIAESYLWYGLPADDLVGEAHQGLMRAACQFDPDRGIGFATFAAWWVRAAVQQFTLKNWSAAAMGTPASRATLLRSFRHVCGHLRMLGDTATPMKFSDPGQPAPMLTGARRNRPTNSDICLPKGGRQRFSDSGDGLGADTVACLGHSQP